MSRAGMHGVAVVRQRVHRRTRKSRAISQGRRRGTEWRHQGRQAPRRPRTSLVEAKAAPDFLMCDPGGLASSLAQARLGNGEGILEILELVSGDDDCGRLVLVCDRDPFPVPGRVPHQGLQGGTTAARGIDSAMTSVCRTRLTQAATRMLHVVKPRTSEGLVVRGYRIAGAGGDLECQLGQATSAAAAAMARPAGA